MIDYIKTKHIQLIDINNFDWQISVNENTGEIRPIQTTEYKGMKLIRKTDKVFLRGSLHKFFNNGEHNYNDFRYCDLLNVCRELRKFIGVPLNTIFLENVEFGVNIKLPFNPERILSSLILHKGESFHRMTEGKGVQCSHAQFYIKIYDKGHQYKQPDNILRLEIKVIKMAYFNNQKIEIKSIADLLNLETQHKLSELLTKIINEILFCDSKLLTNTKITTTEKIIIANGANQNYWNILKPNSKNFISGNNSSEYRKQRKQYYRKIEQFENTLLKHDTGLKSHLLARVRDKFTDLLPESDKSDTLKRDKFTDIQKINYDITTIKKNDDSDTENCTKGTNLHCSYTVNIPLSRKCAITNLDISMQKTNSKFLGVVGIRYYYENEPEIFNQLKKRLSDRWQNATKETLFKEIAHSVRNEGQNPRNNHKRQSRYGYPKLFDDTPYYGERLKKSINLLT